MSDNVQSPRPGPSVAAGGAARFRAGLLRCAPGWGEAGVEVAPPVRQLGRLAEAILL